MFIYATYTSYATHTTLTPHVRAYLVLAIDLIWSDNNELWSDNNERL